MSPCSHLVRGKRLCFNNAETEDHKWPERPTPLVQQQESKSRTAQLLRLPQVLGSFSSSNWTGTASLKLPGQRILWLLCVLASSHPESVFLRNVGVNQRKFLGRKVRGRRPAGPPLSWLQHLDPQSASRLSRAQGAGRGAMRADPRGPGEETHSDGWAARENNAQEPWREGSRRPEISSV